METKLTLPAASLDQEAFMLSLVDDSGRVRYPSSGMKALLGYSSEQMTGSDWFSFLHDEDARRVREQFGTLVRSGGLTRRWVVRFQTSGGENCPVEVRAHNLMSDPSVGAILLSLRQMPARALAGD